MAVLESRVIGAGQTGRTTAHLMPWNDDYYHIQVGTLAVPAIRDDRDTPNMVSVVFSYTSTTLLQEVTPARTIACMWAGHLQFAV